MKKLVKALTSLVLSAALMVSNVNVKFNSNDAEALGENKIKAADIQIKSQISKKELEKIETIAMEDVTEAVKKVSEYETENEYNEAVSAVLTAYYKNEKYDELKVFESKLDERAAKIVANYKEAAKERNAGEEINGFKTQTLAVVFDGELTKKEIKNIVEAEDAKIVDINKDFVGNYSVELKISYGQTVDMAKEAFGEYSETVCASADYIYEQTDYSVVNNVAAEQSADARDLVNDRTRYSQWYLNLINAGEAWEYVANTEHEKVLVGVIDSGVDVNHEDLKNVMSPLSADITGAEPVLLKDMDTPYATSHGTMVTGFIAAEANNGIGLAGVASCFSNDVVEVLGVKASYKEANGSAYFYGTNIFKAFDYCVNNGVKVINTSFGSSENDPYYKYVLDNATSRGIIIVASAGNGGGHFFMMPADSEKVISVVSTTSANSLSSFSNYGEEKDICAPGTSVISTYPKNNYDYADGTSFSSPIVAGVVAMMCSVNNNLNYYDVLRILVNTSSEEQIRNNYGFTNENIAKGGLVNAGKAVKIADSYTNSTSFAKERLQQIETPSMAIEATAKCVAPKMVQINWEVSENVKSKKYTYNIYEGNNLVASNIKGTSTVLMNVSLGEHIYCVNAVYNGMESLGRSTEIVNVTKNPELETEKQTVEQIKETTTDKNTAEETTEEETTTEEITSEATTKAIVKPFEVIGMNLSSPADNVIGVVWGQDGARLESGCKYNIYIDGNRVKNEVICNYYSFNNIEKGAHQVKVTAVLSGVESDGVTLTVNVNGKSIEVPTQMETEEETTEEVTTETATKTSVNIAKNCYAYASSEESQELKAVNVTDTDMDTRWSSSWSDNQYVVVDLGRVYEVNKVALYWEAAYASRYVIEYSVDGVSFSGINSYSLDGAKKEIVEFLPVEARFIKINCTKRATQYGVSLFEMEVFEYIPDENDRNLSIGKNVTVSSFEADDKKPENMLDGNLATGWASERSDDQWAVIDLGDVYSITKVSLNWESAYAAAYSISISEDGNNWYNVKWVSNDHAGLDETYVCKNARFVKLTMLRRGTSYGYSLNEFSVIGH
ncbi:MAG: hypothetical protein E7254_08130 [Lachnospiraceae bacterium]|nr:hypothetical protein [Lachnospiraceae bacterium]